MEWFNYIRSVWKKKLECSRLCYHLILPICDHFGWLQICIFVRGKILHGRRKWQPILIIAWRTPWTGKPGGLQSMELQRVGHDWATFTRYYKACYSRNACVCYNYVKDFPGGSVVKKPVLHPFLTLHFLPYPINLYLTTLYMLRIPKYIWTYHQIPPDFTSNMLLRSFSHH